MIEGLDTRKEILGYAVILESMTSVFLAHLLDIKDHKKSITLGNKSTSLSFFNKIGLLIDIGALAGDTKSKFQTFMEIRNQFMHNEDAKDFESCYSYLDKKDNFVLARYKQPTSMSKEEQLKKATLELAQDVLGITAKLIHKVKDKYQKKAVADIKTESYDVLINSIKETINETIQSLNVNTTESKTYTKAEVRNVVSKIFDSILDKWKTNVDALLLKSV